MLVDTRDASPFSGMPGVLWAYRFHADGHADAVDAGAMAVESLLASCPAHGWMWLHLNLSDARSAQVIAALPLPEDAREALLSHDTHVSLQRDEDTAYGVFVDWQHQRGVELGADAGLRGDDDTGWLHFVLTAGLLVTARRHALRSVEISRRRVNAGARMTSPERLLEAITEQFADAVERATDGLASRLDHIEDRVLADTIGEERRDLALLRHQTVRLHRPLTAMRRVLKQFEQRHAPEGEHELLLAAVSRLTQRFDDLDGDVTTLQERARLLQDEVAAKLAERTNRHLYVLSMITALLLPPSLVAGVFGMNLPGLPFAHSTHGLALALVLGAGSSVAVYLVLRRMGVARST